MDGISLCLGMRRERPGSNVMATLWTGWLLSILLVNLPNTFAEAGPPAPPSIPKCHIPCDDNGCGVDIHCIWEQSPDQIPCNYTLHWEPADSGKNFVTTGTNLSGFINRAHFFSYNDLTVWVQAENHYGSAKSQAANFNTGEITKPPPPEFTSSHPDPLEISWKLNCNQPHLCLGSCVVRYRTEIDRDWKADKIGSRGSYEFSGPVQPGIDYEFQVRCDCCSGLMSDWGEVEKIRSLESTPDGQLDVWRDCGISPTSLDCVMTWKKLPVSQAHGDIRIYEVSLSYKSGTVVLLNVSTAEPRDLLVCDKTQCYLNSSLKDVSSAVVSAYNSCGATVPSHLPFSIPGKSKNKEAIHIKMDTENLTVSWDHLRNNLSYKEYVVQYKQAGSPPGKGHDWARVNKSRTMEVFKGQFEKCTPYQVSLFIVSHNQSHHHSSVIAYSVQGTPSKVRSFKVLSIAATHVTLSWEPVPLSMRNGVILHYQIGVERENVYNVTESQEHGNSTYKLLHLSPGQDYKVWINAVTVAGAGPKATTRFRTTHHEPFARFIPVLSLCSLLIIICVGFVFRGKNKACPLACRCLNEKVPDPHNSRIFKHQMNEPLDWTCAPHCDAHPTISILEIVEIHPSVFDQRANAVTEECERAEHRNRREEYSKMIDSDEERDREEEVNRNDSWSSENDQFISGYEKHFMPTAQEILQI